jgi:hypothetical protein
MVMAMLSSNIDEQAHLLSEPADLFFALSLTSSI